MSVLIEDMKKPKFCYEIIDGKYEQCQFVNANNDCILLLNKGVCKTWWADQYSKCPLIETLEPCEDAVSRKAVYEAMIEKGWHSRRYRLGETWELNGTEIREALDTVPSVTPKRKTGRWLDNYQYGYKCSECGAYLEIDCGDLEMNFCPNCGAKMNGSE